MTKRDFQAIARALYTARTFKDRADKRDREVECAIYQWDQAVETVTDALAADNPRFDRARFMEACETGKCKGMKG